MAEQEPPAFNIKDRRHFNVDGTTRESEVPEELQPERVSSSAGAPTIIGGEGTLRQEPGTAAPAFIDFLSGLVLSAQASMGLIDHPGLRGAEPDFQSARQIIDLLGLLQEKTRGNLSPEEERFLKGGLADLRMNFVRRSSQQKNPK